MLLVDKPGGPTSHDCVVTVRRRIGIRRVGHLGTLDPTATGLLVLVVGAATRLARLGARWFKQYDGLAVLGTVTDTDDASGRPLRTSPDWEGLTREVIEEHMRALVGSLEMVPPAVSAKKVDGERAYRRARRGATVALPPTPVEVQSFELTGWDPPQVDFTARVSGGTYIRSLARELGERLGCGAHLGALRRTDVGPYRIQDAVAPHDVTIDDLRAVDVLATGWPRRDLTDPEWDAFSNGRSVAGPPDAGVVTVFLEGELVGIGEGASDAVHPRVVLPRA